MPMSSEDRTILHQRLADIKSAYPSSEEYTGRRQEAYLRLIAELLVQITTGETVLEVNTENA